MFCIALKTDLKISQETFEPIISDIQLFITDLIDSIENHISLKPDELKLIIKNIFQLIFVKYLKNKISEKPNMSNDEENMFNKFSELNEFVKHIAPYLKNCYCQTDVSITIEKSFLRNVSKFLSNNGLPNFKKDYLKNTDKEDFYIYLFNYLFNFYSTTRNRNISSFNNLVDELLNIVLNENEKFKIQASNFKWFLNMFISVLDEDGLDNNSILLLYKICNDNNILELNRYLLFEPINNNNLDLLNSYTQIYENIFRNEKNDNESYSNFYSKYMQIYSRNNTTSLTTLFSTDKKKFFNKYVLNKIITPIQKSNKAAIDDLNATLDSTINRALKI